MWNALLWLALCLHAIDVAKRLTSEDILERLTHLFVHRGVPEHIRSDNRSEFTAKCVRESLGRVGVKTLFIEPGSLWENGYVEIFDGKLRGELLAREAFDTLLETKVLIEHWRQHYNTIQPHSVLAYRPPAPEPLQPCAVASATAQGWSVGGQNPNLESVGVHGAGQEVHAVTPMSGGADHGRRALTPTRVGLIPGRCQNFAASA